MQTPPVSIDEDARIGLHLGDAITKARITRKPVAIISDVDRGRITVDASGWPHEVGDWTPSGWVRLVVA
jgi:hypothetical protein